MSDMSITIGIIGGSGLYDMAELTDREERTVDDAVRRSVGPVPDRHAARQARRVPGAARRRAPADADRAELPRQHLRDEAARRRVHPVGERGRHPAGALQAAGPGHPRSVLRSHEGARQHVLRQRPGRARRASRIRSAGRSATSPTRRAQTVGATVHKGGTYVCMEGPQFSTLAESKLYRIVGHGHHRDDQPAGSQARARGGDLLRDDRAGHRLRLLASRPRLGDGRHDHREPGREREDRAGGDRRRRVAAALRAHLRVRQRAPARDHHPPRRGPRRVKKRARAASSEGT